MTIKNFLILSFLALVALNGCKKDEIDPNDPFQASFSVQTVEENKANLEDEAIEMVGELDQLSNAQIIEVMMNFSEKSDSIETAASMASQTVDMFSSMTKADYSPKNTFSALKAAAEDPNSFTEIWEEIVGKYTWNMNLKDWDFTEQSDAVIFEFPGLEDDTSNTAVITITNFSAQTFTDAVIDFDAEDMEPELPTSLNIDVTYTGTSIGTYSFSAAYQSNGMPTSFHTKLTAASFSYEVVLSHIPNTSMSLTSSFKHNDKVLIEGHMESNGNWSQEQIEIMESYEGDEMPPVEDVLTNSNAYIQLMNIKVAGTVNVKGLAPAIRSLEKNPADDDDYWYSMEYNQGLADALNANAMLVVVYADNNQKIAEVEAYAYYDEYWDEYWVDFRFIFADESAADAETYFGDGFSGLIDEMNDLIADLNDEYDLDMDPIEE